MSPLAGVPRLSKRRPRRSARLPRSQRLAFPEAIERNYVAALEDYTRRMHAMTMAGLMPLIDRASAALAPVAPPPSEPQDRAPRIDDATTDIAEIFEQLKRVQVKWQQSDPVGQLELFTRQTGQEVATFGKTALSKQIKAISGLDPLFGDINLSARLALFQRSNVELIRSIDAKYFGDIEGVVSRGLASGTRPEQLARQLQERYEVSQSKARLIARDQIGKLHGQLVKARNEELGITHYIWRTAQDERVRETHAEREGKTFAWDDPPEGGAPGEDYQCRCFAEPDVEGLLTRLEGEG